MRRQDTGWLWSYNNIKIHSKSEFVSLKLDRDYSNLLTLSNAGELIRTISKSRKRKKKCIICLHYCIIAVMAVWGSEFHSLCYYVSCVSEFSSQIFLGCLSLPDLEGSAFSRFGVSWVPEVVSHVWRGAFHMDHFLRHDRNWKPRTKSLWHPE